LDRVVAYGGGSCRFSPCNIFVAKWLLACSFATHKFDLLTEDVETPRDVARVDENDARIVAELRSVELIYTHNVTWCMRRHPKPRVLRGAS